MSKLSVHLTGTNGQMGYGEVFLKEPADAGNPVALVYQVNNNTKNDVLKYSPKTGLVYRRQNYTWGRLPNDWWQGDPRTNCENWMLNLRENGKNLVEYWAMNPADYYDPINEPVPGTPEQARWLNDWMVRALEIAHEHGFKLAMFSFPSGCPDYPLWQYFCETSRPSSLRLGKQYGAILSLHAYGIDGNLIDRNPDGSLSENTLSLTLRHRRVWEILPKDCRVLIALTEAGCGSGYDVPLSGDAYVKDAIEFDKEILKDSYVVAANLFQLGGQESNLIEVLGKLTDYIKVTPTPEVVVPPVPDPEPVIPSLPYVVTAYLAPQNATIEQMYLVQTQAFDTKSTVCQSADDARQLVRMGQPGSKAIIYNPQTWPGGTEAIVKYFEGLEVELRYFTHDNPPDETPPTPESLHGVGTGRLEPLTPAEKSAIEISKVNGVLAMTLPSYFQTLDFVKAIKSIRPNICIVGRLFFSVDNTNKTKFNPSDFVAFCKNGLDGLYSQGVRYFQVHNEPNLEQEGFGWNWVDGREFGGWLINVLTILKVRYPEAKWGYPGLSPQPNTEKFWLDSKQAMDSCDWVGVHAYWQSRGTTGWGMESLDGGLHYKRLSTTKPLMITEFSNNSPNVNYAEKGAQYRDYYKLVGIPAFAFCLSWDTDPNLEGWVHNGMVTDIPLVVGA